MFSSEEQNKFDKFQFHGKASDQYAEATDKGLTAHGKATNICMKVTAVGCI